MIGALLTAAAIVFFIVSHACAKYYGETDEPTAYAIGAACGIAGFLCSLFAGHLS